MHFLLNINNKSDVNKPNSLKRYISGNKIDAIFTLFYRLCCYAARCVECTFRGSKERSGCEPVRKCRAKEVSGSTNDKDASSLWVSLETIRKKGDGYNVCESFKFH